MTAQPCPDCGHPIDEKHGAPGCSERVQNGNNTEFCKCRHDAQTAKRLAAGERLAGMVEAAETGENWNEEKEIAREILSYNHPTAPETQAKT